MRAMILARPAPIETRPLALARIPEPEPGPGAVRLRVRACGVCRTDLHVAEGDLPLVKAPVVPGHQVVGVVDAAGPEVVGITKGERVGVAWLHEACGRCRWCDRGLENLCPAASFTGYTVDGGFAEAVVAPAAFAYRIPEGFADETAAPLLCAGAVGYRAFRLSGAARGARLGFFGFGASAHIVLQVARHSGCETFAFTRDPGHQRLARDLGASWAGGPDADPGASLDAAILFAPSGALVPRALERLAPGGTLALAGVTLTEIPPLDYERHLYRERVVRSVTAVTRRDAEELLALAARIPIRPETQAFPLEEANEALRAVKESRVRGAAVLVVG